ncbi:MAG: DUF1648 domain-containing protein [Eubacteriales bacterium]|jgi:hypothetical protein|nr:DUF1648 domain-containing protein [Eubacteriales bacterium]
MSINRSKYVLAMNLICLLFLMGGTIYLVANWANIPLKIPGHYNASGEVDRWGSKWELPVILGVGWLMYIGITIVEHFPRIWNTGVTVTKENKVRVYIILKNMISTTKLIMVVIFVFLTLNSASAKALPVWFLPVFLCLTLGSIIYFAVKLFRAR